MADNYPHYNYEGIPHFMMTKVPGLLKSDAIDQFSIDGLCITVVNDYLVKDHHSPLMEH
jgi:hypothetical protein